MMKLTALCLVLIAVCAAAQDVDDVVPESELSPLAEETSLVYADMYTEAPKGVKHFKKQCWGGCKKKQGCGCAYCGSAGICCRKGWHDHKNGCNGKIGGSGQHQCVKAPKGVCKKEGKSKGKSKGKHKGKRNGKSKKKVSPFTGKTIPGKKEPVQFRLGLKAKKHGDYKSMVKFLGHMMKDGANAHGSKGIFECRHPSSRKVVVYQAWNDAKSFKNFYKSMKVNLKTIKKAMHAKITGVRVSAVPSKAYYCKVWAPMMAKGKISITRKNAAVLKAFSELTVDKVLDSKTVSEGPIGALIIKMAQKVKVTPEIQYAISMNLLKGRFTGGVTKYVLDHIAKAMTSKNGVLTVGPVFGKLGNWVHLDDAAMGLNGHSFGLKAVLSVYPNEFTKKLSKFDKLAVGARLARYYKKKSQLTVKDFHNLFGGKCLGQGMCTMLAKSKCKAEKFCTWSESWDGN